MQSFDLIYLIVSPKCSSQRLSDSICKEYPLNERPAQSCPAHLPRPAHPEDEHLPPPSLQSTVRVFSVAPMVPSTQTHPIFPRNPGGVRWRPTAVSERPPRAEVRTRSLGIKLALLTSAEHPTWVRDGNPMHWPKPLRI